MNRLWRAILAVIFLGGLCGLMWEPAEKLAAPQPHSGDVVIEYWEKWVGPEADSMRQIVDDFNHSVGSQKHIFVQYMSMSAITQKVLIATAAGVPPDIAGMWHEVIAQFSALGAVEPLDEMAAEHGITADYYKPVYWNACHYQGHLYALVSTPGAVALFYNKKIFHENADKLRAAGLDPDRPPRSITELDAYAKVLDTFAIGPDGRQHLDRAGYLPMEPDWYVTQMYMWFGGDVWDSVHQRFNMTDPRVVAAFDWVQSYSRRLGSDAVAEFSSASGGFGTPQNAFLVGKVAMEQQGPWMANYIAQLNPAMVNDWAAAPFPASDPNVKDVAFCPFDALMIPKGCKHPREAFEFIAYVNRQDVMEKLCMMHCKNSPLAPAYVSQNFLKNHPNPYIRVFEELASSPNARGPMDCPIAPEAGAELMAMVQRLVLQARDPATGEIIDAKSGLEKTRQRVDEKWNHYLNMQARRGS